jgi:hypothetical protein
LPIWRITKACFGNNFFGAKSRTASESGEKTSGTYFFALDGPEVLVKSLMPLYGPGVFF